MTTIDYDYEQVTIEGDILGPAVDSPVAPPALRERLRAFAAAHRPPVLSRSVRDTLAVLLRVVLAWLIDLWAHMCKTPKYVARVLIWWPRGVARVTHKLGRWVADVDGRVTREDESRSANPSAHRQLAELHDKHVHHRLIGTAVAVPLVLVVLLVAWLLTPAWVQLVALVVTLVVLAVIGRPGEKRITDRVRTGPGYTRLTAALVRAALVNTRMVKDGDSVQFTQEIHRDGPGQLARVNLPPGVEATEVVTRRRRLSSALRLPLDQVWPSVGPDHEGQLDLWVGHQPSSKMAQPRWELCASDAQVSIFEAFSIGTDQRQRPISTDLFAKNFLIGGVPGSGKSYAARALALGAALDPTVELKIAELKGTADFGDLSPMCSTYVCGIDDASLKETGGIFVWGLAEAGRRAERIRRYREKGLAPLGKVTPELARRRGSGLHPIVIVVDEAHELLVDKDVAGAAERLIKRGRALGMIVILATQIPDKDSVPPAITRCVTMRWCLAVQDHVANDMILGTGSYKRGVSTLDYAPGRDAGWGVLVGLGQPTHIRSHFPDADATAQIVARARHLRGDSVVGGGDTAATTRDPLGDTIRMIGVAGGDRIHWATLVDLLSRHMPDKWSGETRAGLASLMRGLGVAEETVSVGGTKQRGCRLAEVERVAAGQASG